MTTPIYVYVRENKPNAIFITRTPSIKFSKPQHTYYTPSGLTSLTVLKKLKEEFGNVTSIPFTKENMDKIDAIVESVLCERFPFPLRSFLRKPRAN